MSDKSEQLDELLSTIKRGDQGVTPPQELWSGIDSRLEPKQSRHHSSRLRWLGTGLSAVAAGIMAVAVTIGLHTGTNPVTPQSDWFLLAEQMNQAQQQQLNGMLTGYEMSGYQPVVSAPVEQADIKQQLVQLQQAKQQLVRSMQQNGGNAQMLELLRWINHQELQLLQQAYQQQPKLQAI